MRLRTSSSVTADVWFASKGGSYPSEPEIISGILQKRGGSHGGATNWKARRCLLIGSTLYYGEEKAKAPKGYVRLVGLSARKADVELMREGAICIYWPEEPKLGFYLQAPSADLQVQWVEQLRKAAQPTPLSLGELSLQELSQRCARCNLPQSQAQGRAPLEAALAAHLPSPTRRALEKEHSSSALLQRAETAAKALSPSERRPHASTWAPIAGTSSKLIDSLQTKMRQMVSLEKRRFQQDGFDLDLTYITPRIIAMGFPSAGIEGAYRNNAEQVAAFFAKYHSGGKFKCVNLCAERIYEPHAIGASPQSATHYPFDDHNPPCLAMIGAMCAELRDWLFADPANVVAIHCKAGKGRTGLVIACLLLYLGVCADALEALAFFGRQRTNDAKGVTIPSQVRYVHYFANLLNDSSGANSGRPENMSGGVMTPKAGGPSGRRGGVLPPRADSMLPRVPPTIPSPVLRVTRITIKGVPTFDMGGGSDPYVKIKLMSLTWREQLSDEQRASPLVRPHTQVVQRARRIFDSRVYGCTHHAFGSTAEIPVGSESEPLLIQGDVKLEFLDKDTIGSDDKMCSVWLHTAFLTNVSTISLQRKDLDGACKKKEAKRYPSSFALEIATEPSSASLPTQVREMAATTASGESVLERVQRLQAQGMKADEHVDVQ